MVGRALPGPELALLLAELVDRLDRAPASALVDAVLVAEQLSAWTAAAQSRALARLAQPGVAVPMRDLLDAVSAPGSDFAVSEKFRQRAETGADVAGDPAWQAALEQHSSRFAAAEIGAVMTLSPLAARARVDRAVDLVGGAGCLVDAMECGLMDSTRARVLADATRLLPDGVRAAVLDHLFPIAVRYTPSRLRAAAVRLAIRLDPQGAADRADEAHRQRSVEVRSLGDDQARFSADLRADQAIVAYRLIDTLAQELPAEVRVGRSLDQLRADVFADVMTTLARTGRVDLRRDRQPDAAGESVGVLVHLDVIAAISTLSGLDDQPAQLGRYGPITAGLARSIAASAASVRTVTTRPGGGRSLEFGRTVYRPPAALDAFVRGRDRTCRFPGCAIPAHRCDLDHRTPFADGGTTDPDNLDSLCRYHHRLKTFTAWQPIRTETTAPGTALTWRSPLGRTTCVHPPPIPIDTTPPPF